MPDYSEYINIEEGLGRIGGDKRIYARLLNTFVNTKCYDTLCAFLEKGDINSAKDSAHAMKGMAANLSMPALYSASTKLELSLRSGNNDTALFETFKEAMEGTLAAIQEVRNGLQ